MKDSLTLINENSDKIPSFEGYTGLKRLIKAGRLYGDADKFTPHQMACLWVQVAGSGYSKLMEFLKTNPLARIDNAMIITDGRQWGEGFEGVRMQKVSYMPHYKIDIITHGSPYGKPNTIEITTIKLRYTSKPTYDQIRLDYITGNYEKSTISVKE